MLEPFKETTIVLILKGERNSIGPNNYRPISLLENKGKIMKMLINKRLKTIQKNYSMVDNSLDKEDAA